MPMTLSLQFRSFVDPATTRRARFGFVVAGSERTGLVYVNGDIRPGEDLMVAAKRAARVACARAGSQVAELTLIEAPNR